MDSHASPQESHKDVVLARAQVFSGLPEAARHALAASMTVVSLEAGTVLLEQGTPADALFVVEEGLLEVRRRADGVARRVGILGRGAILGEAALLSGGTRNADVLALRDSRLLRLDRASLHDGLHPHPSATLELVRLLLSRSVGADATIDPPSQVITVVPIDEATSSSELVRVLAQAAEASGRRVGLVNEDGTESDVFAGGSDPPDLLLVDGAGSSPWLARSVRNADHVLLVAAASSAPHVRPVEAEVESARCTALQPLLVLLGRPPRGLLRWAEGRSANLARYADDAETAGAILTEVLSSHPDVAWLKRAPLFADLSPSELSALSPRFRLSSRRAGDVLFREGEVAHSLHIVVEGRLEVLTGSPASRLAVLRTGDVVGELGVLRDEPRSATVRATRDSIVAELSRADFDAAQRLQPLVGRRVMNLVIDRLAPRRDRRTPAGGLVVAVLPVDRSPRVLAECHALSGALERLGSVATVDAASVDGALGEGGATLDSGAPAEHALIALLARAEDSARHLVLIGDSEPTPWTQRCVRQADLVLWVVDASQPPAPRPMEREMAEAGHPDRSATSMLVLVHPPGNREGTGTARWLDLRGLDRWAHIWEGSDEDRGRLARRITGRGIGLALSGGGSRGAAHLGVMRALAESGVAVDAVAGTSAGAAVAGLVARRVDLAAATRHVEALLGGVLGHFAGLGPPIVSLMSGAQVHRLLGPWFGELDLEDLPIPLWVAATDVSGACVAPIRRGRIWEAVRASTSVPGLWPPVVREGRLHVDGGVLNNLPADLLAPDCRFGVVLASDVAGVGVGPRDYYVDPHNAVSGWQVLWESVFTRGARRRAKLGSTLVRSMLVSSSAHLDSTVREHVDVLIRPELNGIGMFELRTPDRVAWAADRGYSATLAALRDWSGQEIASIPPVRTASTLPARSPDRTPARLDDLHGSVLRGLLLGALDGFEGTAAHNIAPPRTPATPHLPVTMAPLVGPHGVELSLHDEDVPLRPAWTRLLVGAANAALPLRDLPATWRSSDEAARAQDRVFGPRVPRPHVAWGPPEGADALALFARQGLCAHRLREDGDGFVLDLDILAAYPVRPGYARYGGVLRLRSDGGFRELVRGNRSVLPGDEGFEHEAFAFRSSALLLVTVHDHLGLCHYGLPNILLLAARRTLPPSHPLRGFLRPFLFRTAAINHGALQSLIPRGALVHRATALRWGGLRELFRTMLAGVRYAPLPDELRRHGTHPDQLGARVALLPWSHDGLEWYAGVQGFVDDALQSSPALGAALGPAHGTATRRFWEALASGIPGLPALDQTALAEVLTWLLHVVTALHAHVGHVAPYVRDPGFAAGRVLRGGRIAEAQNTMQLSTVAALTGVPVPLITGRWAALMPDAGAQEAAVRFGRWLATFQERIDTRNEQRQQPFASFSPRAIPCSVSR